MDVEAVDAVRVAAEVVRPGGLWTQVWAVEQTGSTNADLLAEARSGAPAGAVLVAEAQSAARGRLDREWVSPAGAGLTFSMLLRPTMPPAGWSWLPLLTGLAVADAVASAGLQDWLKWPNDVLVGPDRLKVAGILAQAAVDAVVIGVGLNVTTDRRALPETGTSLAAEGAVGLDRTTLLIDVLRGVEDRHSVLTASGGDAERCGLRADYAARCDTVGSLVRAALGGSAVLVGQATGVAEDGRLIVLAEDGREHRIAAGDVTRVRPIR
jgi:BirA family biotin operon repressor/biotin-[acetyl-CoA-carboxylase] ligase